MQKFVPGALSIKPYGGGQFNCVNISARGDHLDSQVPQCQAGPLEAWMPGPCQFGLLQGGHFVAESLFEKNPFQRKFQK